jgi:tight adherence protein C
MTSILVLVAFAIAAATAAFLLMFREAHLRALDARVSKAVIGTSVQLKPAPDLMSWFSAVGARYKRFYAEENLEQLRTILQSSGLNHHRVLPIWLGVKAISMWLFPVGCFLVTQLMGAAQTDVLTLTLIGVAVGVMGPRLILLVLKRRFDAAVRIGTPDMIDLLVLCSEAGMGLESALQRVAEEMSDTNPAMSRVVFGLVDDLRVLPNRSDAFEKLGALSGGLGRVGTMINQSLQYGTPLGQALRVIADDLRRERITKLEEKAHKLGAKLTIPMVLFLLPTMFIILGAGTFLHLVQAIKQ